MGAPIVVNTVKVQGTVASSGTTAVLGTVSQNATWNVNAIQSGAWNIGGTVNQGGSWTVTANAGSGTWPVTAIQSGNWFVGGTVTATNGAAGALFVQGTTTVTNAAAGAVFVQGSVTALPGTSATSLGKVEDAAFTSGDVGVMSLAVRNDSGTALTNTNLDYSPISVDSTGKVQVIERGSTIGQGSVTIGTAMGTVLTTSSTRRTILIQNLGTDYVWLGGSTAIVVNTGARLAPGQTIVIDKSPISAIYSVASSGSQVLSFFTESD